MRVVMHMDVIVPVTVAVSPSVGGGGNHPGTLYYNITEVHCPTTEANTKGGRLGPPPLFSRLSHRARERRGR